MGKFENTFNTFTYIGFFLFPLLSSINHCRYIHILTPHFQCANVAFIEQWVSRSRADGIKCQMKDSFSFILILILQRCAFRKVQYELLKSANLQISVAIILFQPTTEDNKIKKLMHTPLFLFFLQFCPHASS